MLSREHVCNRFDSLDDGLCLRILGLLEPLPHAFRISRTCKRWRGLALDSKNWIHVCSPTQPGRTDTGQNKLAPSWHRTLADAVRASRPGDTILLQPGVHSLLETVVVLKPGLRLLGKAQEMTTLVMPLGLPAFDIRATCKIESLTIQSIKAPCVIHRAGQLALEFCHLTCNAEGLDHLCSPLVTTASMFGSPAHASTGESAGKLSVFECRLEGGCKAVQCQGSGYLQSVRAIYQGRGPAVLYLTVDCRSTKGGRAHAPVLLGSSSWQVPLLMPETKGSPCPQSDAEGDPAVEAVVAAKVAAWLSRPSSSSMIPGDLGARESCPPAQVGSSPTCAASVGSGVGCSQTDMSLEAGGTPLGLLFGGAGEAKSSGQTGIARLVAKLAGGQALSNFHHHFS